MKIGDSIGSYRVIDKLGEGGMGQVYRARDTQLNRDVAIKVLPELFALDAERLARFTREAQTLAALNHPNIAHIYGLADLPAEAGSHTRALVMELVEGNDLSELIARGPIPLADALPIARQIADALEAAHEQGIIHRDLKPANVKVRPDGTVKVLDFGLAKALDPAGTSSGDAMRSPTLTAAAFARGYGEPGTQMGMIIGTAAYMAPEQAKGKAVNKRADIWAFGVVLYEMLTGKRAFEGDDVSEVMASVLKSEPDWRAVPDDTPPPIRRLLRRCLEKEPRKRLSAIGDARLELDDNEPAAAAPLATPVTKRPSMVARFWPAVAGVVLTAAVAAVAWPSSRVAPDEKVTRTSVLAPLGTDLYPDSAVVAISPDGTMIAFIVGSVVGSYNTQLWVRSLDTTSSRRIEAGDGAILPFWSPDSRQIGFFTSSKLKTVAASGGRAQDLCDAPEGRGGTWSRENVIVFAPDAGGSLYRITASGGAPQPVTTLDGARKEYGHRFPSFLPDGKHFVYASLPGKAGKFDIFVGSLDDASRTQVGSMESTPVYADPGWLLYVRQGVLAAQRFDARTRQAAGEPVLLPDEPTSVVDPATSFTAGRAISVSSTGALAYFSAPSINTIAEWYDTGGRRTGTLNLPAGHYEAARISPDGTRAVLVRSTSPSESALWLADLARGNASPLTAGRGRNDAPVWSADGTRVVFVADRDGPQDLFVKTVDGASPEQPLYRSDVLFKMPRAWSPDGKSIVMTQFDVNSGQNVWLLPATGKPDLKRLVESPSNEDSGPLSPDGRWLTYLAEDTGRVELYVQSFPEPGRRVQVSQHGASLAWWTPDGRRLLYLANDQRTLWRVDVDAGATLRTGTPSQIATFPAGIVSMDAMPDRQRFLAIAPERTGPGSLTIVQNWLASLTQGAKN